MVYTGKYKKDGKLFGFEIESISEQIAQLEVVKIYGQTAEILGRVSMTIPTKKDGLTPNWEEAIDYDQQNFN